MNQRINYAVRDMKDGLRGPYTRAEAVQLVQEWDEMHPEEAPHRVMELVLVPDPLPTTPGSVATIDGVLRVLHCAPEVCLPIWKAVSEKCSPLLHYVAKESRSVTVHFDAASIKGGADE